MALLEELSGCKLVRLTLAFSSEGPALTSDRSIINGSLLLNGFAAPRIQEVFPPYFPTEQHCQGPVLPGGAERECHHSRPAGTEPVSGWLNTLYAFHQVKLVSIDATDVADGNASIILGLIWNIILFFQVIRRFLLFLFS